MALESSLDVPVFETDGDERDFWMQRYRELDQKYQAVKQENEALSHEIQVLKQRVALCESCSSEDKDDEELPPAKRQRIDEEVNESSFELLEGLKPLGLDEILHIMKYLKGKELLGCMEVSQGWKQFIEGQRLLMNRAMSEVVIVPDLKKCISFSMINIIRRGSRRYKHMKISRSDIPNNFKYFVQLPMIQSYASTLETLEIDNNYLDMDMYAEDHFDFDDESFTSLFEGVICEFPKLRMLKYDGEFMTRLQYFSFPSLTHLQLENTNRYNYGVIFLSFSKLVEVLHKFPKLECLNAEDFEFDESENEEVWKNVQYPKLKQLFLPAYLNSFMSQFGDSLQVLELQNIRLNQIAHLLKTFKVLKSLTTLGVDFNLEEIFEQNTSIETLKMAFTCCYYERLFSPQWRQLVKCLLQALPSLKVFVFDGKIEEDLIKFIAANMINLKKVICRNMTEGVMQAYREVQRDSYLYKNTTFELIAEPDLQLQEIKKNFV